MTTIHPTDSTLFDLVLAHSKEGIVIRIGHAMTVVDPDDLKRQVDALATDILLERTLHDQI